MGHTDPFLSIDREHENNLIASDKFDAAVEAAARVAAASLRSKARNGDAAVLADIDDQLAFRFSTDGVSVHLIRTALSMGPAAVGQLLDDLISKSVEHLAELAAVKEVESRASHR